ncbi:MAG: ABC transporter permease [Coriobacteriia bacterium]|nr:ABC transporter permease [Coriobacteriia bacterium]
MRSTLTIIKANLQKGIGQAVSLMAFALIAALLLSIGLLLMLGFDSFFDERSEALHAPHYLLIEEKALFSQDQVDYLKNHADVTEVETEQIIFMTAEFLYNDGKMPSDFIFVDTNAKRSMNDLTLIEGAAPKTDRDVCLPYMFKAGGGYQLGDNFTLTVGTQKYSFTICGFTEEIMLGSPNNQMYQAYLSSQGYKALNTKAPEFEGMIIRVRTQDPTDSEALYHDCIKQFFFKTDIAGADRAHIQSLSYYGSKVVRTMIPGIISAVMVVFAAIIILVSLLVVRFRIHNSIEETITNIGALKALGYTGNKLLWATVLQFSLVAFVGALLGIGVSYLAIPFVSNVMEMQTALQWQGGFDPLSSGLTLAAILVAVFIVTLFSARRIRSLQPLAALRQGLSTHSFKRNHLPLDRSRGPLALLLAVKSAIQAKGQMVMIVIIITAVGFAATAGLSIYVNLGINPEAFSKLIGGEVPDATFFLKDPADAKDLRRYLEDQDETRKVFYYQDLNVMTRDMRVNNIVAEDFSLFEGVLLYEGRYPKHDNELCISGYLSGMIDVHINDTLKVTQGSRTEEYLVVGLIQTMNNGGMACAMTIPGMQRIMPDYQPSQLYVYLDDGTQAAALLKRVEAKFTDELALSINVSELMGAQLGMYGDIFFSVAVAMLAITILVIILVLYLMLKTVILRQRRTLGIQKAVGFTTFQLMNQFALYYLPVITLGVALGGLAGILGFNSVFIAVIRYMGLMTASMPAPVELTLAMCAALVLVAYAFALLISGRIRKISAYTLVSE